VLCSFLQEQTWEEQAAHKKTILADVPVRRVKLATARKHTHIIACSKSAAEDEQRLYESGRPAEALDVK